MKTTGEDVRIAPSAIIKVDANAVIGSHVAIDHGFYCTTQLLLGDYIHIAAYVTVTGGAGGMLIMRNFTTLAVGTRIHCVSDEHLGEGLVGPLILPLQRDRLHKGPVIIETFAAVCTNAILMPNVRILEGAVIGAGCLVPVDFVAQPWTIYVGNPIKALKKRPSDKMKRYAQELGYVI